MVALLAVALIGMVGLALDVGRLMVAKAELRRAVDAAALAGALKLDDHPEIEASEYMAEHEPEADVEYPAPPGERQFEVIATKYVDLTFLKVLTLVPGLELEDPVAVSANAVAGFGIQPIDTYMAIDATGSMGANPPCNSSDSNPECPIKAAKTAAANFVDVLLDDSPGAEYTKVGEAPFRGCYNLPRTYSDCVDDTAPGSMWSDLTANKSAITSTINSITAVGGTGTNVCLGMLKGQETLFGPSSQTASNTMKILVILSDGDNTYNNSSYSSSQGAPPLACRPDTSPWNDDQYVDTACRSAQTRERELDTKTKTLMTTMKSQGVEIYVVGFGVCSTNDPNQFPTTSYCNGIGNGDHDNTADRRLLKCVASSTTGTNDHYFEVPTAEQLPAVFDQIARNIAFRLIK